jgi:uncharacterized protein YcbX
VTAVVCGLAVTAVKGTQVRAVQEVEFDRHGAWGNRRFFVVDERGRMVNGKMLGALQSVLAEVVDGDLRLGFPDGAVLSGPVELGEPIVTRFFSSEREARPLRGPWSERLSEYVGRSVRIVDGGPASDRGLDGGVSLISRASMARLASEARESDIDVRRFRMLIEIDGVGAHEEDRWIGHTVMIGRAMVRFHGNIGRCMVTSRDPETGEVDLPMLDILGGYRRGVASTEPLPFGIYGQVTADGPVRVGDRVVVI